MPTSGDRMSPTYWRTCAVFNPPHGECFLALRDGEAMGVCMLKPHSGGGEMNGMYVRPAARGLGLGRRLAEAVISDARALGDRALYLDALYRHVEALPLCHSLGFAAYERPDTQLAGDAREIHMRLDLTV